MMGTKSCQAKMATQTMKGTYVNSKMPAIDDSEIATIVRLHVHPLRQPSPSKKLSKASTHQTRSAGRPAAPPSPYQSPPRAAFPARATQHQATRGGRARERGRRAKRAQASPPPLPCGSVTPTQSPCAVGDGGGHAYDTQRRRGRWMAHGASRVR
jgi:hypothetical protein